MSGMMFDNVESSTLGLFFTHREIGAPKPKRQTVNIPLRDGSIDLTEQLTGATRYENRAIKLEFETALSRAYWPEILKNVYSAIHGKRMSITFPEDLMWHYVGFVSVDSWKDNGSSMTINVSVDAEPYRRFYDEMDAGLHTITSTTAVVITLEDDKAEPRFITSAQMTLTMNGDAVTLTSGTNDSHGFELRKGQNTLLFDGSGTVQIYYTREAL